MICTEVKANPEHIFQTDKMKIKTMLGVGVESCDLKKNVIGDCVKICNRSSKRQVQEAT